MGNSHVDSRIGADLLSLHGEKLRETERKAVDNGESGDTPL